MNFKNAAEAAASYIIEQRRWFHQHPELSWEEYNTTDKITEELTAMGYEVQRFEGKTGCCALLRGGKAAEGCKTVALRADIDALPVEEKTCMPFASENSGVMHACGHDGHISMLLGAAKMLMDSKDELRGNVKLIFQAAEETCHGAEYYVDAGVLDGVDAIMGQHIWGTMESPYMSFQAGRRMASCDNFTIKVDGSSTHGTTPHLGKDALMGAASILMNLQTFVSRNNNPLNPLVVTVGEMHAGQRFNIIANHAEMYGTVRTFDPKFRLEIEANLRRIVENTAAALGLTASVSYEYFCIPIINDDDQLTEIARRAAISLYGEEALRDLPMMMSSEDFSYFADKVPSVFGFLGSRNETAGLTASNHNDRYSVDESCLHKGAAMYAQFAADFLEANA